MKNLILEEEKINELTSEEIEENKCYGFSGYL